MYYESKAGDAELEAFARGASLYKITCRGYDLFVHPETEHFPKNSDSLRNTITAPEFGYLMRDIIASGKKNPRIVLQFFSEISIFPVVLNTACSYSQTGLLLVDFPRIDTEELRFNKGDTLETRIVEHFRSSSAPPVIGDKCITEDVCHEIPYPVIKDAINRKIPYGKAIASRQLILTSTFGVVGCNALAELVKHSKVCRTSNTKEESGLYLDIAMYAATEQPRDPITGELNDDFVTPLAVFGARGHQLSIDFMFSGGEYSTYRVLRRWRND